MKYLLFLVLIFPLYSMAKPIVISSDELSLAESKARIQSLNGISYANHILSKLKKEAQAKNIFEKAVELRKYELSLENEKIYELCSVAFDIRHDADWSADDRAFFIRCFKHLLHLSSDPRKRLALEIEILAFTESSTNKKSHIQIWIRDIQIWILINGITYAPSQNRIALPNTSFRMTLISNQFERITKVVTKEEFLQFKPKLKSLISGSCENGFRYESTELSSYEIKKALVASRHCKKALISNHPIETKYSIKKKSKFKIPKWAWWIAGGIVGYSVYEKSRGSNSTPAKTSKRGFP